MENNLRILVTGAAGFIGFHVCEKLISLKINVVGVDNLNNYYDTDLKKNRLNNLGLGNKDLDSTKNKNKLFDFYKIDINDHLKLEEIFKKHNFSHVIHLAAQAGVRYSIENPKTYIENNIMGFWNIIELSRQFNIEHFIYASSSSVYGSSDKTPFNVNQKTDEPLSLYAATKKSNELIAHSYSNIYNLKTTGLRFFTAYGPWGRPDMAYYSFTKSILNNTQINVFNNGNLKRDFTFIDDIVEGVYRILISQPNYNYKIYNLGNNKSIGLLDFIKTLESLLGEKANIIFMPHQDGDVYETCANIDPFISEHQFNPTTSLEVGLKTFINWYKEYHKT
mgnify:CR=1 FL=1|tara:strand:- start:328 stop:1332 length:1005 start_codon:yes stop_codon:yes gene_type:complete